MAIKAKKPVKVQRPLGELAEEYSAISEQIKVLENRKKAIAEEIKNRAETEGVKDSDGSFRCESDTFRFGKSARKSISLNQEKAKEFFVNRGLWSRVVDVKTVETINEDKIEALVKAEEIETSDIAGLCDEKVTFAVYVTAKDLVKEEEMPEVQKSGGKK